jgi:hypothetical protein
MSSHTFRNLVTGALCATLVFLPDRATAQFGGLIKKATEKATEKTAEKTTDRARDKVMDKTDVSKLGSEFTAENLDRILTSLEMTADARRQSDSIGRVVEPLDKQLRDLSTRSESEINGYHTKKNAWTECRDNASRAFTDAHADQTQAAADQLAAKYRSDPAAAQRLVADMGKMQTAANAALSKGDTASAKRIMQDWYKKNGMEGVGGITDAELNAKCGVVPPVPASVTQRHQLEARLGALRTQQRESLEAAFAKAQEASGLPAAQFYPMNERIERWYAIAVEGKKGAHFWTDQEGALFEARRARIERVFKQLRA